MRKHIKFVACLLTLVICSAMLMGFARNDKVYDEAGLLSSDEIRALQERCLKIAEEKELDIVIVTTDDAQGKSSRDYADDFFDYNDFGYENPMGTGIIYLIDMDNREGWVSTSGNAVDYFTDSRIYQITGNIQPYLANARYYESAEIFLNYVELFMGDLPDENAGGAGDEEDIVDDDWYDDGSSYEDYGSEKGFHVNFTEVMIYLFIAVIIGGVSVFIMVHNAGGKVTVNSRTYLNPNTVKIKQKRDVYTHTTTTSRTISDDSNSHSGGGFSGGSSTHVSSSGNTHGGGGCKF